MFSNPEVFFDLWPILDDLQKFVFLKSKRISENALLIKNIVNPNIDNFICLSDGKIDYHIIEKEIQKPVVLISYYSKDNDRHQIQYIPENYKVSFINSSVIFENCNNQKIENTPDYYIGKATIEDVRDFVCEDEHLKHDYIKQIKDSITDKNCEVLVLKNDHKNVCFLVLMNSISKRFNRKCKCISVVYTLPSCRGKGYAQYLIQSVLNANPSFKFLYIADSNKNFASLNLAKKCGFVTIGYNHQIRIEK